MRGDTEGRERLSDRKKKGSKRGVGEVKSARGQE